MRLTGRCREILRLLAVARWLSTRQLHRRFFAHATLDATRKRILKLVEANYLVKVQQNPMTESLFRLGPEGKRQLERSGVNEVHVPRQVPKQLEHFQGVNDIRIAAELSFPLLYFFTYWELPGINWNQSIIPDAIFGTGKLVFAVEFDRGQENLQYFVRTKIRRYRLGLSGFSHDHLLVVTDRQTRLRALAKAVAVNGNTILLTRLDLIQQHGLNAPIFETSTQKEIKLR